MSKIILSKLKPAIRSITTARISNFFLAVLIGFTVSSFSGCQSSQTAQPLTLIEKNNTPYVIVCNTNSAPDKFAAKELVEIIKGSTGVDLEVVNVDSEKAKAAEKRILLGRNSLTRKALGDNLLDSLKKQESLVTSRGNDLILVGGDDWGILYAVYDFVENEAGYRNFLPAPGGERFVKTNTLRFSGKETRRPIAFKGYRECHPKGWPGIDPLTSEKFFFRNRINSIPNYARDSGLKEEFHFRNHCHGFGFIGWKETFAKHPEYFTMNKDGKRISTAQLCLSHPDCRKLVTRKVLEIIKRDRPKGINCYVVASNDWHGSRYCWCPNCLALEKKYNSTGGPLWDYLLELCAEVKKSYPDVLISTLAYKGPKQTEKAPDNTVFPDNFIADCAFLNSMLSLKEIPAKTLENGERFQKYENLQKWADITKHTSYWFYGHATGPTAIYERPAKELRELRDAGVESIFHCNFGGEQQFGPICRYVTLRLMIDPDQDPKALATEAAEFFYGAAAPMMMAHMAEMEKLRLSPGLSPVAQNPYTAFTMLKPKQLLRWQKEFDKMEALTKNDPKANFFVRQSRTAVDIWTIIFLRKIQKEFPDFKPDIQAIVDKGLRTCDEMKKLKIEPKGNKVRYAFESMQLLATLKDNSVPAALKSYPKENLIRHLPGKVGKKIPLTPDKDAIAAYAIKVRVPDKKTYKDGVGFELYDALERKWLMRGQKTHIPKEKIVPNKYKLYKAGTDRLPKKSRFVVGGLWGSGLDINALASYYDQEKHFGKYDIWVSLKFEGPKFDPKSQAKESFISWDQIFLVDKGTVE